MAGNPAGESAVRWTAIVLAGERPEGDPLAAAMGVPAKALIALEGRTLLEHVLRALLATPAVGPVVVLAQDTARLTRGEPSDVLGDPRIGFVQSGNGIAASVQAIVGTERAPWPVLVTTADNALLTPARVERFLAGAGGVDLAVGVGERRIVEREFPATRRTWLKFRDGHYSGANLFALTGPRCLGALERWSAVEKDRKKGLRLVASFGPALLLRALTRTIAFPDALSRAAAKLGCTARPVVLDAEAPIDVDKPDDVALVSRILARRAGGG